MDNRSPEKPDRESALLGQDDPPAEQKKKPTPKTLAELVKIAEEEANLQSAVRGPIVVPEWGGMEIYYRRMGATRQNEVVKSYVENGREDYAIFAERALLENGERMFPNNWGTYVADLKRWNQEVISRVVSEMSAGSKTQLTDEDLGNS